MGIGGAKPDIVKGMAEDDGNVPAYIGTGGAIAPPEDLSPGAIEVWNMLVPDIAQTGVYRESDEILLSELCESLALARHFRRALQPIIAGGELDSPEAKRLRSGYRESMQTAMSIAGEFGISPVARLRLGLMRVKGTSLLDALENRRRQRDAGADV